MHRNFKNVSNMVFGRGSFNQLGEILAPRRTPDGFAVFLLDDVFTDQALKDRVPLKKDDLLLLVSTVHEPKTSQVDELTQKVRAHKNGKAVAVTGIGGGSVMDLAKAVSLMLTNPGSSADYQGWDLIKNPAVFHACAPTLSGTGAEVSRTTVLTGPDKKLGINSDYTVFDQLVLDPELVAGVPANQRFYTGMDCYIHCVESLNGGFINAYSKAYAEKAMEICRAVFLENGPTADDDLMMASYFGGLSIAYSQVGVCHALSYGLSFVLGVHHGVGNCIVFNQLEEYYGQSVAEFRHMAETNEVSLPKGVTAGATDDQLEKMVDVSLVLKPLWEHALGPDWEQKMPRSKIRELFQRM